MRVKRVFQLAAFLRSKGVLTYLYNDDECSALWQVWKNLIAKKSLKQNKTYPQGYLSWSWWGVQDVVQDVQDVQDVARTGGG